MAQKFHFPNPNSLNGQEYAPKKIRTIIPFLSINPDGRSGGLGEAGIAISPDAGAIYHNASKLAFIKKNIGFELSHTPWFRSFVDDLSLTYFSAYKRINESQTIGVSLRYFSLGSITFTDVVGSGNYRPIEWAIDLAYARKLSDKTSVGINLKYALSDLARIKGMNRPYGIVQPSQTIAIDLSLYHQNSNATFLNKKSTFSWGVALSNMGNKIAYTEDQTKNFIPINLGIGTAIDMHLSKRNNLMFTLDINKLMVPTPDPEDPTFAHREKALLSGMLGSFTDAPGGFSEELQELMFSIGIEYWYNNLLALRLGYFNEHAFKGNRKYPTAGIGLKHNTLGFNLSYIIPTGKYPNPLDNTLRFQLNFDFGEKG